MKVSTCLKLIVLGLVLIALGIGIRVGMQALRFHTSPEQLRGALYDQLAGTLDAEVELGAVSLNDEGLLCAEGLSLRLPGETEPFFACRKLLIAVDKLRALRLQPVPEKVTILEPVVNLSYSRSDHRWNIERLRVREGAGTPGAPPPGLLRDGIVLEDATVNVRSEAIFDDLEPRTYEGLYLDVSPERGLQSWHARGALREGLLRGTALSGWVRPKGRAEFNIDVRAGRLEADESLWHLVPQGHRVWGEYAVHGLVACQGTVSQRAGEEVRVSFGVDLVKVGVRVPFYPVRLADAHGHMHITERDAVLENCTGVIPPGELDPAAPDTPQAEVRVSGAASLTGLGGTFCIEAFDVPFGRKTITAIPNAGPEIWRRLAPTGQARLHLTVSDRPDSQRDPFTAVIDLSDATVTPPELPLPLRRVGGRLVVDGRTVRLNNVTGLIVQEPARTDAAPSVAGFAVDGVYNLQHEATRLKLTVNNLKPDKDIVLALPGVGPGVWEMFRPEVVLDATALLTDTPGQDEMAATVLLDIHGGTVRPNFLPMPLGDVCGTMRVEDNRVFLERVTAVIDTDASGGDSTGSRGVVKLHGIVLPESGAADVYIEAGNLRLTEPILAAVPEVGVRVWEEARPKGMVSVHGRVRYDPVRPMPVRFLLSVDLEDVSALPRFLPIPVDALAGQLLLTEEQAISNDVSGVACGGQFQGAAVAYYGEGVELPSYGAQLQFSQVELGALARAITGTDRDITGRLTGALAVGGLAGDPLSTAGKGVVSLADGRLWETPFFARLLSVLRFTAPPDEDATTRGEASFVLSGDTVYVREFELTGGGLNLRGYGEAMLDGRLNLTMVATGAPQRGGIPIVTPLMGWLLQFVERELVQLHVTGTIDEPKFEPTVLATITSQFTGLPRVLLSPFRSRQR